MSRFQFLVPDVGEGIASVELVEWHVDVGQAVREDAALVTVQTDKALVELPCPVTGVVLERSGSEGDILEVGAVLATFEAEQVPEVLANAQSREPTSAAAATAAPTPAAAVRVQASPVVRKVAREFGIDLAAIAGTGPGGRITRDDVLRAASGPEPPASESPVPAAAAGAPPYPGVQATTNGRGAVSDERIPFRGLRRETARRMVEAWRTVPHITEFREVDATRLVEVRRALREGRGEEGAALTYIPLFVKIAAVALRRYPLLNATLDEEASEIVAHGACNIGIATATADGLVVPVVTDADRKNVFEIAREVRELTAAARTRRLTPHQLSGGTYTITNYGVFGSWTATPIIRVPEVGILGVGRISDRVIPVDGVPAVRPVLPLSTAADHRVVDGDVLGSFTTALADMLANPALLLGDLR